MLDLETLSTRSNAAILQIAAIAFDLETGEMGPEFCRFINEPGPGVHFAPETIRWRMQQPRAALIAAECEELGVPLVEALEAFREWLECSGPGDLLEGLWSHGLTFDVPILAASFERNDMTAPWNYRTPRDTRTLFAAAPGGMLRPPKDETREHDALYDCEYQIAQVCAAWAALRRQREVAEIFAVYEAAAIETYGTERADTIPAPSGHTHDHPDHPPVAGGYSGQCGF